MKTIFTFCFAIVTLVSVAQSFNTPNCVVYDYQRGCYFVSNAGNNTISSVVPGQNPLNFVSSVVNPTALTIVGDTLYVCNNTSYLAAYNINTRVQLFNKDLGSYQFSGACADSTGNIFLISSGPSRIIRFTAATRSFVVFRLLTGTLSAIAYDKTNHKLVIGTSGNVAVIYGVDINTAIVTLLKQTGLTNISSIAIDRHSNVIAGYDTLNSTGIYIIDSGFAHPPVKIISYPSSTDHRLTFFNQADDVLAVPNVSSNKVLFYPFSRAQSLQTTMLVGQTQTICVLQNDTPGLSTNLQNISTPVLGSFTVLNNCITYTAGAIGTDTITYAACLTGVPYYCSTGTAIINNLDSSINYAPIAADDISSTIWFDTIKVNVTLNDFDINADSMCVYSVTGSSRFTIDSANCNNIVYVADSSFLGNDTCLYVVCDNDTLPLCDTATFIVNVKVDSSYYPRPNFVFTHSNILCYDVKAINITPNDTGTAKWIFKQQNYPPYTTYGDTAYYLNMNQHWFYGEVCLYVSNQYGSDSLCVWHGSFCEGIKDQAFLNSFALVPNPANESVNMALDVSENNYFNFVITSSDGRLLDEITAGVLSVGKYNKTISVAHLANGIYFIGCKTNAGTVYKKLLVQH